MCDVSMVVLCIYGWCGAEVNAWVLGKWLELLSFRFKINQLLFADITVVADSLEKLGRLVSEFGRVCEEESCE